MQVLHSQDPPRSTALAPKHTASRVGARGQHAARHAAAPRMHQEGNPGRGFQDGCRHLELRQTSSGRAVQSESRLYRLEGQRAAPSISCMRWPPPFLPWVAVPEGPRQPFVKQRQMAPCGAGLWPARLWGLRHRHHQPQRLLMRNAQDIHGRGHHS